MPHPYTTTLMLIIFSVYCYSDTHQQNANQEDVHPGTVSKIKPVDGVVRKFDESAEVRCFPSVAGAKLSWYRNDELLTDDDKKYIISTENSSLTIKAAQTNDVGVYQCAEDDEPRVNVTLYSVPYVRGEKSINTSPGHSVTLDCKPRGLPVPEVTWYGSDQLILPDGKRFALKNSTVLNGQLVINNLEYSDYKIYTCVATNMYGSYNGTTLVRVKTILIESDNYVESPFDNAEISCQSFTSPRPPLRWFKNGVEIVSKPGKYEITPANGTLEVQRVGEEDVGPYVCSESPTENATATIFVGAFAVNGETKTPAPGDKVELECEAWGYPSPDVTWYADGVPVVPDGIRVFVEDRPTKHNNLIMKGGKLVILNAQKTDPSRYTCQAVNTFGERNATTNVFVKDNMAPLWPFLGIALELGAIGGGVGFYEYKKKKQSDTEKRRDAEIRKTNNVEYKRAEELQMKQ